MDTVIKLNTCDLVGTDLDLAVALAENRNCTVMAGVVCLTNLNGNCTDEFKPSIDSNHCEYLIEKYIRAVVLLDNEWYAYAKGGKAGVCIGDLYIDVGPYEADGKGETPLIAICRAVVATNLGYVVDIPCY